MDNNTQNPYNHPLMGQQPMQPPPSPLPSMRKRPAPRGWRERWMRRFGMDTTVPLKRGELTVPDWLTGRAIVVFFVAMFACWVAFGYVPAMDLILAACISIIIFFAGGSAMLRSWHREGEKGFVQNVFVAGLTVRLSWMLYCYFFFNMEHYGHIYGDDADTGWYMDFGKAIAEWVTGESPMTFTELAKQWQAAMDDWGYPIWYAIEYVIFGNWSDVFIPMLIKCVVSAYCAICIYRVAQRHFGEGAARIAAIFVCLNPNVIYWCGTMFKEAEMVFLCCLAVDNFDRVLSSGKQYTFKALLPGILAGLALMFFRTALGLVFFLAVFAHIVMASRRVMSMGKKILAGLLVALVLAVSMGDRIRTQSRELVEKVQSDSQGQNMEWRASQTEASGRQQSFAKYASAAVFAPLIFTIPFPTFCQANEAQLLQVQLSGGNYIRNILSFFVIILLLMMLISGEWRRHVFIIAYTCGYLMVLVMSAFAQSGRFHMPIWPMLMLFAAYGIQVAKVNVKLRRWFSIALVIEVVACLAWNWFKLKGRGMI